MRVGLLGEGTLLKMRCAVTTGDKHFSVKRRRRRSTSIRPLVLEVHVSGSANSTNSSLIVHDMAESRTAVVAL